MIGFSQGAALTALISLQTAITRVSKMETDIDFRTDNCLNNDKIHFPAELMEFKFAILFSGFRSHSSRHSHIYHVCEQKVITSASIRFN